MAKFYHMHAFSGVVGDVVGCNGPFGFYIRSRPKRKKRKPSPGQVEWRAKLALAIRFLAPLKEIVYRGWAMPSGPKCKTAAMNRAVSLTVSVAVEGSFPDLKINPEKIQLSRGSLCKLLELSMSVTHKIVEVKWLSGLTVFPAFADDTVYVVAYHVGEKIVLGALAERIHANVTIDLSAEPIGSEWLVYACVSTREGKRFANSQFIGKIILTA
ncbi:hypothetical protein GCM10023231_00480 [Olivibacter ginsenosidimutans]|uniref:Uncharacterized protein n=1 Tax=Olivibacter ginsenosidimutans TaxID=1176537 RepID=A0ABP9ADK6_9SPHI